MLITRCLAPLTLVVLGLTAWACWAPADEPAPESDASDKMVAHDLYFALKDPSPENRAALIAECRRCLAPHPGVVYFATGILADDMRGAFVDRDFDVAVHMVFKNRQALKDYARTKLHGEFVTQQASKFKGFRIFDSEIEVYDANRP